MMVYVLFLESRLHYIEVSQLVRITLDKAGFIAHPTKSFWQPTQRLQWLGFVIDVEFEQIEVPPEMLALLRSTLSQADNLLRSRKEL